MCFAQLTLETPQVTAMLRVRLLSGLTAAAETLHLALIRF